MLWLRLVQIEKARGAESLLQACLSALSNEADAADVRERLGLLPVEEEDGKKKDANAVHKALLQVSYYSSHCSPFSHPQAGIPRVIPANFRRGWSRMMW